MYYLVIDAELSTTGIRHKYESGSVDPVEIGVSHKTIIWLNEWLAKYEKEHYLSFANTQVIEELDKEGIAIAITIKSELLLPKIEYCSTAYLTHKLL